MDSNLQSKSPNKADMKPSFRKPSNDAANRKYRRRSPSGSASSSSGGSPWHGRSRSPINYREDTPKISDDRRRKKDGRRDLDRDAGRSRHGRGGDTSRDYGRQFHGSSLDYRRHDDHNRQHKYSTEGDRDYQRMSSRSGREPSGSSRSDHMRHESEHDRSRDYLHRVDKYSRDKPEDVGRSSKDKERETTDLERQKYSSKDLSSDRAVSGRRYTSSNMEERSGDRDRHGRDRGGWDDKKDYRRSSRDHKNDRTSSYEESRGYEKDSSIGRDSGGSRVKETLCSNPKELDVQKDVTTKKRKSDDREPEQHKEQCDREPEEHLENDYRHSSGHRKRDGRHEQVKDKTSGLNEDQDSSIKKQKFSNSGSKSMTSELDEGPSSSLKQVQETSDKANQEPAHSSAAEAEATTDLNAAKVAAMKAAELVNRNLIGSGYMSTDQKKKLLWGSKKNVATEESGHRWDLPLFSDRERQEKFNKLMGVKGETKLEHNPEDKDGNGILRSEKQKELELDLEKHYTAGLRRRDGRTVGLGL
ncbi:arginine/serine-rich coiled-coil protein 2 isoform X2 [Macadamia integrifolia]|uniref:arginine/serine-rich coiled-coil protein 2 isoform X2 n=1 Tax=Macadamia integrifolia TaxID=60698 RepID=UPI001C4E6ACC|nr:arginine/serine-rich coiled-coil protein 2 isoform X2 [Macadamia integrifolia]